VGVLGLEDGMPRIDQFVDEELSAMSFQTLFRHAIRSYEDGDTIAANNPDLGRPPEMKQ
jgi:hypothetical protein